MVASSSLAAVMLMQKGMMMNSGIALPVCLAERFRRLHDFLDRHHAAIPKDSVIYGNVGGGATVSISDCDSEDAGSSPVCQP